MKLYYSLVLLPVLLLSGCNKDDQLELENLRVPRLMIEARGIDYGSLGGKVAELPVSGSRIPLQKEPIVNEFDIVNAEMVNVELGHALLLQVNEKGARALYRSTVSNMGGRIVVTVNDNPIGARRVDGPIQDGNFYTFVEGLDEEALGQLVLDIKDSILKLQELKNK